MTRREFRTLADPAVVRDTIDSLSLGSGTEQVAIEAAHDRVLATRIDASLDVPGFDRAAMDGYAVVASDTVGATASDPNTLDIGGTVHAGTEPTVTVEAGAVAAIATGAVLPGGADAVVPVEQTSEHDDTVDIRAPVTPGDNVMPRGADIAAGDRTLSSGTRLGPRHLGLLAALGRETVTVRRHPRVGIVSTGDELVQPGDRLSPESGQIYDVNSHSLSGAVRAAGGVPAVYDTAADTREQLAATLQTAAEECDLLCTSGSTSAGERDLLYELVEDEGEKLVHGVSLKPGRPMLVGRLFETPYVGLPGYPVSALTIFRTFVAPAIRDAVGRPDPAQATVEARLATRVHYDGGRLRLLAVGLVADGDGSLVAYAPRKGSGATTTLGEADGVVRMPPERSLYEPGTTVSVDLFDHRDPIPSVLGVGEPDPTLFDALDSVGHSRYLTLGEEQVRRWAEQDIPDFTVTVGDHDDAIADWSRSWGLAVPAGNPAGIGGLSDLLGTETQFVNLDDSLGLRAAFDDELATRETVDDPAGQIPGYTRALPGIESAARAVAADRADAGLALEQTASKLGLDFVPLGTQQVCVQSQPERADKPAVQSLRTALMDADVN